MELLADIFNRPDRPGRQCAKGCQLLVCRSERLGGGVTGAISTFELLPDRAVKYMLDPA